MSENFNQTARFASIWFGVCVIAGVLIAAFGVFDRIPAIAFAGAAVIGASLIPVFSFERVLFARPTPQRETQTLLVGIVSALFGISLIATDYQTAALVCMGFGALLMHVAKKMKKRRISA